MKFFQLFLVFMSIAIYSGYADEKDSVIEEKIANEAKQQEVIIAKFKEVFSEKAAQGDKAAMELAERAQKNAGNLNISFDEMKKLLLSWDKSMKKEIDKLPTVAEKTKLVKDKFEKMLKERVAAKHEEATKLTQEGMLNGKISLSVKQMQVFIDKWEGEGK